MCTARIVSVEFPPADAGGFTLVELIAVVLLLGILSVFAVSRMIGPTSFTPALVVGEIVSVARLTQQTAMSRQDATVSLLFDSVGNDWRLQVVVDDGAGSSVVHTTRTERRNSDATIVNGASTLPLSGADVLRVTFDGLGNVDDAAAGASPLDPAMGIRIDVSGDVVYDLCIAPTGFVHRGSCA